MVASNIKYSILGFNFDFCFCSIGFYRQQAYYFRDLEHSADEKSYYCLGRVSDGILTVRFTYRSNKTRIFSAGYWQKGKKIYEKENKIH